MCVEQSLIGLAILASLNEYRGTKTGLSNVAVEAPLPCDAEYRAAIVAARIPAMEWMTPLFRPWFASCFTCLEALLKRAPNRTEPCDFLTAAQRYAACHQTPDAEASAAMAVWFPIGLGAAGTDVGRESVAAAGLCHG